MVSLGDDSRRIGSFNNGPPSIAQSDRDELLDDAHIQLVNGHGSAFVKIQTVWISVVFILIMILEAVASFVVPFILLPKLCDTNCKMSPESWLTYSSCLIWCLYFCGDRYLRNKHYKSRLLGYLNFYRQTCTLRQIPLIVLSTGNVMLLIVWTATYDFCPTVPVDSSCPILDRLNYIQIVICGEAALLLVVHSIYIAKVVKFNKEKPQPDVQQDDVILAHINSDGRGQDVGFRENSSVDDLLDKQSDMIHYLKQHNTLLARKLLELTSQLETRG